MCKWVGERAWWTLLGGGEGMVDSTWWGRGHGGLYLVGERAWWTLLEWLGERVGCMQACQLSRFALERKGF